MASRRLVVLMIMSGLVAASAGSAAAAPGSVPTVDPPGYGWTHIDREPQLYEADRLYGVWSDGSEVWAVGTTSEDGYGFSYGLRCSAACEALELAPVDEVHGDAYLRDVSGTSADDVWAVGAAATGAFQSLAVIQHFDGTTWSLVDTSHLGSAGLSSVSAVAVDDVWALGCRASEDRETVVLHWDGTAWSDVADQLPDAYQRCDSSPMPHLLAANGRVYLPLGGDLLVYADGGWSVALDRPADVTAVGLVGDQVWAAGGRPADGDLRSKVWREQDTGWRSVPSFGTVDGRITTLIGSDADNVWVGGRADFVGNTPAWMLRHWDGTAWSAPPAPTDGFRVYRGTDFYSLTDSVIGPEGRPWITGGVSLSEGWDGVDDVLRRGPAPEDAPR